MVVVSDCLPSDALFQCLPSYWGFSYLGHGVSLHSCSRKVQPLLLTLDKGYLLTTAPLDLEGGVAPLGPPAPSGGHHQMVNTEIRLIIFFEEKDGEALYSQQKQDWELTVAQILNSLLPNSDLN